MHCIVAGHTVFEPGAVLPHCLQGPVDSAAGVSDSVHRVAVADEVELSKDQARNVVQWFMGVEYASAQIVPNLLVNSQLHDAVGAHVELRIAEDSLAFRQVV